MPSDAPPPLPPPLPPGTPGRRPSDDQNTGWAIIGLLISGMVVWGGAGWLLDKLFGFSSLFLLIGLIVGVATAIYLVVVKYGKA